MSGLSWIDLAWPMIAAASATLAAVHLAIWFRQKTRRASLLLAVTGASVAVIAFLELLLMRTQSTDAYEDIVRWAHVPIASMVIGMVGFVLVHYRAGNRFLAAATCVTRIAILLPNFTTGANLNFLSVERLQSLQMWGGETIQAPLEVAVNPWTALGHANVILLLLFLSSAIVETWRRGRSRERRSVVLVCGAMVLFTVVAGGWTGAVMHGSVVGPLMFSPAFLFVLLAMGYELGGEILHASQIARNLVATERTLQDTQRRMDQAVHAAGVGLWNWDIEAGKSWFSDPARSMLGVEEGAEFGISQLVARLHPRDRHNIEKALASAAAGDGYFRCEYRIVLPGRGTRWISTRGQVEYDAPRIPLRMDGVLVDITERKQAEERFRLVVETAPVAMLVVDPDGVIELANRQAETLFGYTRAELVGRPVELVVPARFLHQKGRRTRLMAAPSTSEAGKGLFGIHKDGSEVPVDIALNPVPMEAGAYLLVSMLDLTERDRLERESALQRDELAHLSRVALLAELSGSLAHELNQPLTAVLANAQAAARFLDHVPPNLDEVRDALVNIVDSDKRAGEVIRRLRAMLRKEPSDYRMLAINEVVLDVLGIIRSDLLARNVDVDLDLAEDLPLVQGDKVQLQQVLLNLIMNASDAMNGVVGQRVISMRTRPTHAGKVEVTVSDIGKGIPGDDIQRIFSPFVTTKRDGLGLGLAVCTTIVNAHEGKLWAVNNDDRGATFGFSLPFHVA